MPTEAEKDLLRLNSLPVDPVRKTRTRARRPLRRSKAPSRVTIRRYLYSFIVAAIFFEGVTYALRPHCEAWLLTRDVPALERRMASETQKRDDLQWQLRFAESPRGAAALSRDYGFIKPNEVPFVLPGQGKLTQRFEVPEPETLTLWDRFMYGLCKVCHAGPEVVRQDAPKG